MLVKSLIWVIVYMMGQIAANRQPLSHGVQFYKMTRFSRISKENEMLRKKEIFKTLSSHKEDRSARKIIDDSQEDYMSIQQASFPVDI